MPYFTYLGISEEDRKSRFKKQCKGLDPPEKRGQAAKFHIKKKDGEAARVEKRRLTKIWLDKRKKEIGEALDAANAKVTFSNPLNANMLEDFDQIEFPKGVPVHLDEDHPLVRKLTDLSVGVKQKQKHEGHVVVKHESFLIKGDEEHESDDVGRGGPLLSDKNAKEACVFIGACEDVELLKSCHENEERVTVQSAIVLRVKELQPAAD